MKTTRLTRDELVSLLGEMSRRGHSDKDSNRMLLVFCANCPDPVAALNIVLDAPPGTSDVELVDASLALPARDVSTWSESDLPRDHPLRRVVIELDRGE